MWRSIAPKPRGEIGWYAPSSAAMPHAALGPQEMGLQCVGRFGPLRSEREAPLWRDKRLPEIAVNS